MNNNDIVPGFDDGKDDKLDIRLETVRGLDHGLLLYLAGDVDTYNANTFLKRVRVAIDVGYHKLILNCAGLGVVSSDVFGCFAAFLKAVKPKGGDLVLVQVQPKVLEVFQLLGLSRFYNMAKTIEEAVAFFKGPEAASGSPTPAPAATATVAAFPKVVACPVCGTKLKAEKPGRFRCSSCKTVLEIEASGRIAQS